MSHVSLHTAAIQVHQAKQVQPISIARLCGRIWPSRTRGYTLRGTPAPW
jgi:hypothetical protein